MAKTSILKKFWGRFERVSDAGTRGIRDFAWGEQIRRKWGSEAPREVKRLQLHQVQIMQNHI